MYNQELLKKMTKQFGVEKVTQFAEMVSFMYDFLYEDAKMNGSDEPIEYEFERDWWQNKFDELKSIKTCSNY